MPIDEEKIIYKGISYVLNGIFFKTHNLLGRFCGEKQYSDAIERLLREKNIKYEREHAVPVFFTGETPRRSIVDFLIEGKIIVEVKAKLRIEPQDYFQLKRYLTSYNKKLGILVNFRRRNIVSKRVLNPQYSHE